MAVYDNGVVIGVTVIYYNYSDDYSYKLRLQLGLQKQFNLQILQLITQMPGAGTP